MTTCDIHETHCENCGNTDREDLLESYTACCGELRADHPGECRGFHCERVAR